MSTARLAVPGRPTGVAPAGAHGGVARHIGGPRTSPAVNLFFREGVFGAAENSAGGAARGA